MVIKLKYLKDTVSNELIIEKSKFITSIYNVSSIEEVNEILSSTRKKYYDATHNCYAYILGDNANIAKASDDGEPSKTAGFPILDVLKKNDLTNVLCIVTRYFGGILLGAGGLVRAYSSSTSEALKKGILLEKKYLNRLIIKLDYSTYNSIINKLNGKIIDQSFQSDIALTIAVSSEELENTIDLINSASKAKAIITNDGLFEIFLPANISKA